MADNNDLNAESTAPDTDPHPSAELSPLPPLAEVLPEGEARVLEQNRLANALLHYHHAAIETRFGLTSPADVRALFDASAPSKALDALIRACPVLLARYYPAEAVGSIRGYDGLSYADFEAGYRKAIAAANESVRTLGLPPEALRESDARNQIPLDQIFVPLTVTTDDSKSEKLSLANFLNRPQSAVILGDPGTGKSTLLKFVALLYAGGAALEGFEAPRRVLPIIVSLRAYAQALRATPDLSFLHYFERQARAHSVHRAHRAHFEAALLLGDALVLFDGLDEVGQDDARHRIAKQIGAFQSQYPAARVWVTSRVYGYTRDIALSKKDFLHVRAGRLDEAQIDDFVRRWYAIQEPHNEAERGRLTGSLRDAIRRTPSVGRLASNPLLLTLMAFIHQGLRKLPQDRGELYEKCVEMLLKTWQEAKRHEDDPILHAFERLGLHAHRQKDYLAHLAMYIQEKNQGHQGDDARGLVDRKDAVEVLAARHFEVTGRERLALDKSVAREEMRSFLDYISDRTGLLIDRGGGQLSFIHLSFQEYLAAWVFTCVGAEDGELFEAKIGEPAWEEVLLLRLYIVLSTPGGGGGKVFDFVASRVLRKLEETDSQQGWLTLARALRDNLGFRAADKRLILEKSISYWLVEPVFSESWYAVLEEITLFAEKNKEELRKLLIEGIERRDAAQAIACLHLTSRLFGFPDEATAALPSRRDFRAMMADLCAFWDEPSAAPLLAAARPSEWAAFLYAIHWRLIYLSTAGWMIDPPSFPAALEGAAALLWRRSIADLESRAAFAAKHSGRSDAGDLFTTGGIVRVKGRSYALEVPFSALRAPGRRLDVHPGSFDRLMQQALTARRAIQWALFIKKPSATPVKRWVSRLIAQALPQLPADAGFDPASAAELSHHFTTTFLTHFGRSFSLSLRGPLGDVVTAFIRDFESDFGRAFVRSLFHEYIRCLARALHSFSALDQGFRAGASDIDVELARALSQEGTAALKVDAALPAPRLSPLAHPSVFPQLLIDVWLAFGAVSLSCSLRQMYVQSPTGQPEGGAVDAWVDQNPLDACFRALGWAEHAELLRERGVGLRGPQGALILAHAAYVSLMSGVLCDAPVWREMLEGRDKADKRIEAAYLMYEICCFRDVESNVDAWNKLIQDPPEELRPMLEAAGLYASPAAHAPDPPSEARRIVAAEPIAPEQKTMNTKRPAEEILCSWIHLSDVHLGHGGVSHGWDQDLVLDALARDVDKLHRDQHAPAPRFIFVTGDVAFSGKPAQYEKAKAWLARVAKIVGLDLHRVIVVPGNHDVDREADKDRNTKRLVRDLRSGEEDLDDALKNDGDRAMLAGRMAAYLAFAKEIGSPEELFWSRAWDKDGVRLRVVGVNTALLAADDQDQTRLRLGKAQIALLRDVHDDELTILLSHHPFEEKWLADEKDARAWTERRADIHLCGHVHAAEAVQRRTGGGTGIVTVVAGAAHGDKQPAGVPDSHGYTWGAVVRTVDPNNHPVLRVWPRRWSQRMDFRLDVDQVPEGKLFAEHALPRLRLPVKRGA